MNARKSKIVGRLRDWWAAIVLCSIGAAFLAPLMVDWVQKTVMPMANTHINETLSGAAWVSSETKRRYLWCHDAQHAPTFDYCRPARDQMVRAAIAYTTTSLACEHGWLSKWADERGVSRSPARNTFDTVYSRSPYVYSCGSPVAGRDLLTVPLGAGLALTAFALGAALQRRRAHRTAALLFTPIGVAGFAFVDAWPLPTPTLTAMHAIMVVGELGQVSAIWMAGSFAGAVAARWALRLAPNAKSAYRSLHIRCARVYQAATNPDSLSPVVAVPTPQAPPPAEPNPLEGLRNRALGPQAQKLLANTVISLEH